MLFSSLKLWGRGLLTLAFFFILCSIQIFSVLKGGGGVPLDYEIQVRVSLEAAQVLALWPSKEAAAVEVLEEFPGVYSQGLGALRGRFSWQELACILEGGKGIGLVDWSRLGDSIKEASGVTALAQEVGVDLEALGVKVNALGPVERLALKVWACGYWELKENSWPQPSLESWMKLLE